MSAEPYRSVSLPPFVKPLLCVLYELQHESGERVSPVPRSVIEIVLNGLMSEAEIEKAIDWLHQARLITSEYSKRFVSSFYAKWVLSDGRVIERTEATGDVVVQERSFVLKDYNPSKEKLTFGQLLERALEDPSPPFQKGLVRGEDEIILVNGVERKRIPDWYQETCTLCFEKFNWAAQVYEKVVACPACGCEISHNYVGTLVLGITQEGFRLACEMKYGFEQFKVFGKAGSEQSNSKATPLIESKRPRKPRYDTDTRELQLGNVILKRFKQPSPNQVTILRAFQEDDWPIKLDNPFNGAGARDKLREAIRSLNSGQSQIHFMADGTGDGVIWELVPPSKHP